MTSIQESVNGRGEYRKYLPDLTSVRFVALRAHDAYQHLEFFNERRNPPWAHALFQYWRRLLQEPFHGVTDNGTVIPGLFKLQDESAPIENIVGTAQSLLSQLNEDQLKAVSYHIDSPEWRTWSNPEFLISNKGLRLDEVGENVREAVLRVLEATLSPEGYRKALAAMRINHYLGELVNGLRVMNEYSYNFVLFGTPAIDRPWGWSFYGHHLCLNVFLYRRQIVLSPWFTGAEPNLIDDGPHAGTRILFAEEQLGLKLMQNLPPASQQVAQIYKLMVDPSMPPGRWNHDDQRHLCGAYRDNRVVPYEGVLVSTLPTEHQDLVFAIIEEYLLYLPRKSRQLQLEHIHSFVSETYFSWIGSFGLEDPFYYRIQSPVVIVEFDHHSGVYLTNGEPQKFHIHTLLRLPNGGDYGHALRSLIPPLASDFIWDGDATRLS